MWKYQNTDELYHYGILGMRWGVRKNNTKHNKKKSQSKYYKKSNQIKKNHKKENIKTDSKIKKMINRGRTFTNTLLSQMRNMQNMQIMQNMQNMQNQMAAREFIDSVNLHNIAAMRSSYYVVIHI